MGFGGGGWFEGGELGVEHVGFHVMVLAGGEALPDEVEGAVEVDEVGLVGLVGAEDLTVVLFEGGAGENGRFSLNNMLSEEGV